MIVVQEGDIKNIVIWLGSILVEVVLCGHVVALVPVGVPPSEDRESGLDIKGHVLLIPECN